MTEGLQSKESKEQVFKTRLNKILERKITVETIDSYMDRAVDELIHLTDEIVADYRIKNPNEVATGSELEDLAYADNTLPNIGEFLDVAQQKSEQLYHVDGYIKSAITTKSEVITPPDVFGGFSSAGGYYEKPDVKHRLKALLYILKDHGIDLDRIVAQDGVLRGNMVREMSYVSVTIPELNRLVLVCDEEGNASYIFDLEKLQDRGVSADAVGAMTKEDYKVFIEQNPGVGVRFAYSSNWMERVEDLMFNEFTEEQKKEPSDVERLRGLPKASSTELDPWRTFWTDPETGNHWSNLTMLSERLRVNRNILETIIKKESFASKKIVGVSNREVDAFCYEDLAAHGHLQDLLNAPSVETSEWKGFFIDEQGKHWAGRSEMAEKLGISQTFIRKYYTGETFPLKTIRQTGGKVVSAICYEDFIEYKEIKDFLSAPRVEAMGEWKGFWTDPEGNHWAGIAALTEHMDIKRAGLASIIEDGAFDKKTIRPLSGPLADGFCIEVLLQNVQVKRILAAPRVERAGEWKGFWTDPEGKHWGTKWVMSEKGELPYEAIERIMAAQGDMFVSKDTRDLSDRLASTFCYEDLMKIDQIKKFRSLPRVEKEGEWKGFRKEGDGKHYGTLRQIALRLNQDRASLEKIIKSKGIASREILDGAGRFGDGYAYEDFLEY